ncbi:MAG: hypothetical protein ACP5U1_04685, partial [Desulfomonilaceae bacterium]
GPPTAAASPSPATTFMNFLLLSSIVDHLLDSFTEPRATLKRGLSLLVFVCEKSPKRKKQH